MDQPIEYTNEINLTPEEERMNAEQVKFVSEQPPMSSDEIVAQVKLLAESSTRKRVKWEMS
jgi:hypothetical protein